MIYVAANNNLEPNSITNMMEMAKVGSSADMNVVVQLTRPPDYTGFYGEWGGTRRFLITKSDGNVSSGDFEISTQRLTAYLNKIAPDAGIPASAVSDLAQAPKAVQEKTALSVSISQVDPNNPLTPLQVTSVQDLGSNVNSGDAATLSDFGTWAIKNYPADHYALVVWDHGGGWSMIASDDTLGDSGMKMPDLGNALKDITAAAGVDKLDVIGFDACLMAQLPVAVTVAPYANYMIGSEELVPGAGWNYDPPLQAIASDAASITPEDIGKADVDSFYTEYTTTLKDDGDTFDIGLLDLSKVDGVTTSLDALNQAIQADPDHALSAIGDARSNVQQFADTGKDSTETDAFSSVDLIHLMQLIAKSSKDAGVQKAANDVIDAANAMILYHKHSDSLPNSNGLSVFFPRDAETFTNADGDRYTQEFGTLLPAWQSFMDNFYGNAKTSAQAAQASTPLTVKPQAEAPSEAVSATNPPTIPFDLGGQDIVAVTAYVEYQLDPQTQITVDTFSVPAPDKDANGDPVYDYPDGPSTVNFTWDVKIPTLSDGKTIVPVLVSLNQDDPTIGYIDGTYTSQLSGKSTPGYVTVDMSTMTVDSAWAHIKQGGVNTESEILIQAGDTFEPSYQVIDDKGDITLTPSGKTLVFAGDPQTFDAKPLAVAYIPAPDGDYKILIEADDVAGNVNISQVPVTVKQ